MLADKGPEFGALVVGEHLRTHQLGIELRPQHACLVVHEGNAPGHAGAEIRTHGTKDDDGAARHVLTPVMPHTFDDGDCAAVAYGEALAGAAGHEQAAARGAVKGSVSDENRTCGHPALWADNEGSAVESFADAVVCGAVDRDVKARYAERAERLARRACEMHMHRRTRHSCSAETTCDVSRKRRAHCAIGVLNRRGERKRFTSEQRARSCEQASVQRQRTRRAVVRLAAGSEARASGNRREKRREIHC